MYNAAMNAEIDQLEPGERQPAPTAGLRLVQEFVNTNDIEGERDALGTPDRLQAWLQARGYLPASAAISADAHRRTLAVREGLRALGRAHNEEPLDARRVAALNEAAASVPLVASFDAADWELRPAGEGLDAFLAEIVAAVVAAMADGSWSRIKACRNDDCRWLFYDHSRNRSGTWCTMALCGSRAKARAYRARQRDVAGA